MGRYRVFYFEDLDRGEVIIGCPVCKRIERNFIEPVAVILEKGNYEKFDGHLKEIKSLEELKENKELFEKILNKDDLVCILHQNKEGKHWEEDTDEFALLYSPFLIHNNILFQFWHKIRAYRFAVDYRDLWEKVRQNWEEFKNELNGKVNLEELEKDKNFLKLYLKKENWKKEENNYNFIDVIFPLSLTYFQADLFRIENGVYKAQIDLNFWYKDETISFQNKVNFLNAKFKGMSIFSGTIFKNIAFFGGTEFQNITDFSEAKFQNIVYFGKAKFQNEVYFTKAIFQDEAYFIDNIFLNIANFSEAIFENITNLSKAIFKNKVSFSRAKFQDKVDLSFIEFQNEVVFNEVIFEKEVYLRGCNIARFVLDDINLQKETYFEINNCNFIALNFANFINHTDNFLVLNFGINTDLKKGFAEDKLNYIWNNFLQDYYEENLDFVKFTKSFVGDILEKYKNVNLPDEERTKEAKKLLNNLKDKLKKYKIEEPNISHEDEEKIIQNLADIISLASLLPFLEINNCTLNNMKFLNCDFSQAERITIRNSFIENVAFNNVDWGKISEDRINPDVLEEDPKSARDTYRQIKYALDKQADHINANWFYALEMKAYEKYLKTFSWKDHFQEKLVFSIHKFISEFGISWVRPLVLIVLSTIIMLGLGTKLFPTGEIENKTSTTIFGFVVDKFYYVAPLWNIDFWVIYIALATIGIYFYFYLIWKINEVKLEKKEIGYEDAGFTFKAFNINSYKILISLFFIALPIYLIGLLWLYSGNSLITAVLEFLDRFATTLNIFKVFSHFVGEDSSLHKLYSGYLFLYKIYAIFILVLIYQLILAIRRRVRR